MKGPTLTQFSPDSRPPSRSAAKAARRQQILAAAAPLFARRGLLGVRLEDIGAAVGLSGPALYRHFSSKEALVEELLSGISDYLLEGAREVVRGRGNDGYATGSRPDEVLNNLVDFHVDFALTNPALITLQSRELASLSPAAQSVIRTKQREYVELWVGLLRQCHETLTDSDARIMAHAGFGAMNSTPYFSGSLADKEGTARTREVLRRMAHAALGGG